MSSQADRIQPLPPQKQNAAQKEAYEYLEKAMSADFEANNREIFSIHNAEDAFIGPLAPCVYYPELAKPYAELLAAVGSVEKLPAEVRETNILAVGSRFQAAFELYAHGKNAVATSSLSSEQVRDMQQGIKAEGLDARSSLVWDIARYLVEKPGPLPQEIWDRGVEVLGQDMLAAVVVNTGVYAFTSIMLNAVNASVPGSEKVE